MSLFNFQLEQLTNTSFLLHQTGFPPIVDIYFTFYNVTTRNTDLDLTCDRALLSSRDVKHGG